MELTYSYYSFKNKKRDLDWDMSYYKASIVKAKTLGHTIKLYSDKFAYEKLKPYINEYVDISNESFILTDDLKLYIHSKENLNCITIDGDIILENTLETSDNFSVIFDRRGRIKSRKEPSIFSSYFNILQRYEIEKSIPLFDYEGIFSSNVGLLKFNNQEVKDLLIDKYYEIRKYFLNVIEPKENIVDKSDFAKLLCEYYFTRVIEKKEISVGYFETFNNYVHYYSDRKNSKEFTSRVNIILNKEYDKI